MDKNDNNRLPIQTMLCRAEPHQYRIKSDHRPSASKIDVLSRKIPSLNLVTIILQAVVTWPSDTFETYSR